MADNKERTGKRDSLKVDMNDASEIEYLHQQYPKLQHQQVVDAIIRYGPLRKDIERELRKL